MMQGYDREAAVAAIAPAMAKAAHMPLPQAAEFARRAIQADMDYMRACGALTADGLMGEGEYDEDDAFETLFESLTAQESDEETIGRIAAMLDAYMQAQQDFLARSGLAQD